MPFIILLIAILPKIGYILGAFALLLGAGVMKWWLIGLIIMTWWSRGAIGMANQAVSRGDITKKQVSRIIVSHWVFMTALYAVSIWSIAK